MQICKEQEIYDSLLVFLNLRKIYSQWYYYTFSSHSTSAFSSTSSDSKCVSPYIQRTLFAYKLQFQHCTVATGNSWRLLPETTQHSLQHDERERKRRQQRGREEERCKGKERRKEVRVQKKDHCDHCHVSVSAGQQSFGGLWQFNRVCICQWSENCLFSQI